MLSKADSTNKMFLRVRLDNFIHEYNGIIEDLNLLKEKIIIDSNLRFREIAKHLSILRKENKQKLKNTIDDLNCCKNINIAYNLLEKENKLKENFKDLRFLARTNKFNYEDELNDFIRVFNAYIADISNSIEINELEKFKNFSYFSSELIDELIELFQKYFICLSNWNVLNNEISELLGEERNNKKRG